MPLRAAASRSGYPSRGSRGANGSARPARVESVARALTLLLLSMTTSACFMGYDSRWGQQKAAQQRNAAVSAPSSLRAAGTEEGEPAAPTPRAASSRVKKLRMRALVTRSFTAHVVDTPRHLREMLEDVNKVTERDLGVHLELVETRAWEPPNEDDIVTSFDALRATEPGDGVDWVAGFVGALPRATRMFHDAGRGSLVGKHVLLRAANSADRHDGIERAFDELPEEQRRGLEKQLRRHRAAALFLHEIGHTLGAPHSADPQSIMFHQYNPKMASFDASAVDGMRELLASDRTPPKPVLAVNAAPVALAAPAEPDVPGTPELTGAARERYVDAYRASQRGDVVAAWNTLKPLFDAHARSMSVQDLRCQIASRSMRFEVARRECAPLMKLSTAVPVE